MPLEESVIGSLITEGITRSSSIGLKKAREIWDKKIGPEVEDELATDFEQSLRKTVLDIAEQQKRETLSKTAEEWETVTREIEKADIDFKDPKEATEKITTAIATAAEIDLNSHPNLEEDLNNAVRNVCTETLEDLKGWVQEDAPEEFLIEVNIDLVQSINRLLEQLEQKKGQPKIYHSLEDFESRLYGHHEYSHIEFSEYVPPNWNYKNSRFIEKEEPREDIRDKIVDLIKSDRKLICIYGDGGVGKSRLLVELGKRLKQQKEVYYVDQPTEIREISFSKDSIIFIDDVGWGNTKEFIKLADASWRNMNSDLQIQVIAAARPIYREVINKTIEKIPQILPLELELHPLTREQVWEIVQNYGLDQKTADTIYEESDGNPFFTILLIGEHFAQDDGGEKLALRRALDRVVGSMISEGYRESDLGQVAERSEDTRTLLEAMAVWLEYRKPQDNDVFVDDHTSALRSQRWSRIVDRLHKGGYVRDELNGSLYLFKYDVISDYIRFEVIEREQEYFRRYAKPVLDRKAPYVIQGLIKLKESPLRPFFSSNVADSIDSQLKWASEAVIESDASVRALFEAQVLVCKYHPNAVNDERLEACLEGREPSKEVLSLINFLIGAYSAHGVSKEKYIKYAERWNNRLGQIYDDYETVAQAQALVNGLYSTLTAHGRKKQFDRAEYLLGWIQQVHEEYPLQSIREQFAKGLFNTLLAYSKNREPNRTDGLLDKFQTLHDDFPDLLIRELLAESLRNVLTSYIMEQQFEQAHETLNQIYSLHEEYCEGTVRVRASDNLFESFPSNHKIQQSCKSVRKHLAQSLQSIIIAYCEAHQVDQIDDPLDKLQKIHKKHPEEQVRKALAESINQAVFYCGEAEKFGQMDTFVNLIQEINECNPHPVYQKALANSLRNAIADFGRNQRFDRVEDLLCRLGELYENHPREFVRESLAWGLNNSLAEYSNVQQYERVNALLNELRALHQKHPEPRVRGALACGLFNVISTCNEIEAFDRIDNLLNELYELYQEGEDFKGPSNMEQFHQESKDLILAWATNREELAIQCLKIVRFELDDVIWSRFSVDIMSDIDSLYQKGEIAGEAYQNFAKICH